ncbi:MAG: acyl-CoA dehydrogenase family protein [Acidimicrobiales bacterium]|nr:acyl-CoA dehydrogenase family protein [Acidimicrobiales bacterium]
MSQISEDEVKTEVANWVDKNWDLELTVAEWWQLMADARLSHTMLPENAGGRGWGRNLNHVVLRTIADKNVLGPPTGLGMMLAAPTIAAHGTEEQIARFIPPILNGQQAWCQLFSEPGAGSDLAGLQCKAEKDGDEWVINGQKVWTSGGQVADMGMLIARTDFDLPKHQGISYFAFDMKQKGVDVRPLTEMTGRALFNEVFVTDGLVPDDAIIGGRSNGWRVANATLTFERSHLGSGSIPVPTAIPGTIAGQLERRAGDLIGRQADRQGGIVIGPRLFHRLTELTHKLGREQDPVLRDELMKLHSLIEVNRLNMLRVKSGTGRTGAEGNIGKLMMSELYRRFCEVGNMVIGADGMLEGSELGDSAWINEVTLFSPAPAIYGGTDQVQRNIIGERVLGLPKEPGPAKETPFIDLPKN